MIAERLKTAIKVTRAPFFTAVILPALLGAALAWHDGFFQSVYLLLTLVGIVSINAGLNMSNDYFDHLSGNDVLNHELTPFSGGSRVIQNGMLAPRQVLAWSLAFYLLGIAIGLYLVVVRGWLLLALGAVGVFVAFFHNAPPIKFYHLGFGVGEVAAGIGCGPLIVLGAYYVQAQRLSYESLWASIPLGLLVTAILYGNEFPDFEADRAVGKKTVPVILGRERAARGYVALVIGAYAALFLGVMLGGLPFWLLLALLSAPLAMRGIRGFVAHHSNTPALIPALATTIQMHIVTGILMCLGYALESLI